MSEAPYEVAADEATGMVTPNTNVTVTEEAEHEPSNAELMHMLSVQGQQIEWLCTAVYGMQATFKGIQAVASGMNGPMGSIIRRAIGVNGNG